MERDTPTLAALVAGLAVAWVAAPTSAQEPLEEDDPVSSSAAIADSCAGEEHRAFDFWLGEWEVTEDGERAGHNDIRRVAGGCALLESWRSARGGSGSSLNFYDPSDGRWHQVWVGSSGSRLRLAGDRRGDAMVLSGERIGSGGESIRDRITWTPREGGVVRQLWEVSTDGGESWRTVFDGVYRRP